MVGGLDEDLEVMLRTPRNVGIQGDAMDWVKKAGDDSMNGELNPILYKNKNKNMRVVSHTHMSISQELNLDYKLSPLGNGSIVIG